MEKNWQILEVKSTEFDNRFEVRMRKREVLRMTVANWLT
jgi:hypothetical protein